MSLFKRDKGLFTFHKALETYSFQESILNMPIDGIPGDSDSLRALLCGTLMLEARVGT